MAERVQARGDFINGEFRLPPAPEDAIELPSPADIDDHVGAFPVAYQQANHAVDCANNAQRQWERTPFAERAAALKRLGQELKRREDRIVLALGREIGKPVWEAKTEVAALVSKIDITLSEGMKLVQDVELDQKLSYRFRPHGVLAVIGPYNFPLHLPHGHIVPALATGNTVVFKPSEIAPLCAQLYMEAVEAAGFPRGVINIVQGKGPTGATLAGHHDVQGLLFTGSYATGRRILEANASRPGFMLALELGGKNAAVVLNDAPFEQAVHDVVYSAFVTAGQRCTCVSRLIVERGIADRFLPAVVEKARALVVGTPTDPTTFMGPVATRPGLEKFLAAQQTEDEVLLASHRPAGLNGYYVTPSIHCDRGYGSFRPHRPEVEIFGPDLEVIIASDLEDACKIANASQYGLAAGVFSTDEAKFEACAARLRVGCLTWNAPTVGSSSRLPFGGVKNSGNQRPAALFSTLYCAYPMAVTKGEQTL